MIVATIEAPNPKAEPRYPIPEPEPEPDTRYPKIPGPSLRSEPALGDAISTPYTLYPNPNPEPLPWVFLVLGGGEGR